MGTVARLLAVLPVALLPACPRGEPEGARADARADDGGRALSREALPGAPDGGAVTGPADAAAAPPDVDRRPAHERLVDLVGRSDARGALALLDGELAGEVRRSPALRYLRGRLLDRLGRHGEAADAYALEGAGLPEDVARDALLRRVEALEEAGRCEEARRLVLDSRAPSIASSGRARAVAARCALAAGETDEATRELRVLARINEPGVDAFEVELALARAAAEAGRSEEARRSLHELLVSRPDHAGSKRALALFRELGGEPTFDASERMGRADRLIARRRFDEALAELEAAGRPARRAQRARWLHLKGTALYRSRQGYGEAAKAFAEAASIGGPDAIDDEFHAARALSRADHDEEAIAAYRKLVEAHPTHGLATEAEYLAAWLELRLGRSGAEAHMEQFLAGPRARSSPTLRREATWQLALRAYERGQHTKAAGLFERYAREGSGGLVRGRGLYWKARSLEALGRKAGAVDVYRRALAVEPLHWYALLAAARLEALGEEPGPPLPGRATASAPPGALPALALPADVAFYASLGLEADAVSALRRRELAVRAAAPRGRELEALVETYLRIGGARRAFLLVAGDGEALGRAPAPTTRWIWAAAYPRPYEALVSAAARESGVEPAHVYATMRQESGYDRDAVSHADAVGLLQVLPSTAAAVGRRLGVEVRREMLFDPAWNIRLGVAEIAGVLEAFDGNLPLAIAGYNAGEARVRRWLRETGEVDLDLFVERIPFDETRNYVRRVTSHYARYRYLEDPAAGWPPALPSRVGPTSARAQADAGAGSR